MVLGLVLVAPAAPASAYVNPYGRYIVGVFARLDQCLTVPFNGVPGTWVIRATCTGGSNQIWHFDRVGTYGGDPVFEIRATHRVNANGEYTDCLDLPNSEIYTGRPLWTWPCNGGNAQRWRQRWAGFNDPVSGTGLYRYTSMVDPNSTWAMQFNNGDAAPHLVMVPPTVSFYQNLYQDYVGP
jgi:hypothetical protein